MHDPGHLVDLWIAQNDRFWEQTRVAALTEAGFLTAWFALKDSPHWLPASMLLISVIIFVLILLVLARHKQWLLAIQRSALQQGALPNPGSPVLGVYSVTWGIVLVAVIAVFNVFLAIGTLLGMHP
jgi:amino acid transporter